MKVLSIDIDYVFDTVDDWPNEDNEMWDNWHPSSKWHFYFCKYPDLDDREKIVNEENLEYLLETYTKALDASPNAKVCFGFDHDFILEGLEGDNIDLVNIDHHDDFLSGCNLDGEKSHELDEDIYLGGHVLEWANIKAFNKVDEGNWGAKLHIDGRLNSMTWIRNPYEHVCDTRIFVNQFICKHLMPTETTFNACFKDEYDHGDYKYDHIFVCISPRYLPPSQWELMSLFMAIYEDKTGKDCMIDEWWDQRYIEKSYNKGPYEIIKKGLLDYKEQLR